MKGFLFHGRRTESANEEGSKEPRFCLRHLPKMNERACPEKHHKDTSTCLARDITVVACIPHCSEEDLSEDLDL